MSYWIDLVEPDRKHRPVIDFGGVHCSWNFREMMEHLPCGWVREWQGKQARDMLQILNDSYFELANHTGLYEKYETDSDRNLGSIESCMNILQQCYAGFSSNPQGIIVVD